MSYCLIVSSGEGRYGSKNVNRSVASETVSRVGLEAK